MWSFLFASIPAFAAGGDQQEYVKPDVEATADKKLTTEFRFDSAWHEYDNLDFRKLDESHGDQGILDSDDRGNFAFTGIQAQVAYAPTTDLSFKLAASHRGLWGGDQIGLVNGFGGFLYVNTLSMDWKPFRKDDDHPGTTFRVGRQTYSLGGIDDAPDFVFWDVIDGVRVDIPLGPGHIEAIPISVVSGVPAANDVNFLTYIGQSAPSPFNFRGATMTRRTGLQYVLDKASDKFDARAYAYYTDIGANGTGSDISYHGELGNFADNDYVANFGARAHLKLGAFRAWGELDGSTGMDRKELVAQDADCIGLAYGAGVALDTGDKDQGFRGRLGYFDAMGPHYTPDGLLFSHGYVSMKGQQVGGIVADRYLGWHPSAYSGYGGVENNPQDKDRKSGTRTLSASVGYDLPQHVNFKLSYWFMMDTGLTDVDFDKLSTLTPPYGYSREEFAAEKRLGQVLGQEMDAEVEGEIGEHVTAYVEGGVLLPGAYYGVLVNRVAGTQLGGQEMGWAASGGMSVVF
jgi:hypothetical protein